MAKYMLLYKGEPTPMEEMSPEDGEAVMAKWGIWAGKVGDALLDMGQPFGPAASVVDDGSDGTAAKVNGYSIIEAGSLGEATDLCNGHPFLEDGDGAFAIDVFELMDVPGM